MPSAISKEDKLGDALTQARAAYAKANPRSAKIYEEACHELPGGTTRHSTYFGPFPMVLASGRGAYVTSVDGREYLDVCGEYSAGMFGHSHPAITRAMHAAIDNGYALGGPNVLEGQVARLLCARFPSLEKVRFSNSGTEAVTTALSLVKAYTGRETLIVMSGAYHGGLVSFDPINGKAGGKRTMNVPHKYVVVPYNDSAALVQAARENSADLAGIVLELMQGSSGCIPASREFVETAAAMARETGAVLLFDEVMTSRASICGQQSVLGITPDMTTLGKYFAGGGANFGAFGGRAEIMDLLDQRNPDGVFHTGTYNNNVTSMAATKAVLEEVWTEEAATELFEKGAWVQDEIRKASAAAGSVLRVSGVGSVFGIHFTGKEVRTARDAADGNMGLRELFFLDMLRRGIYMIKRGMFSLMTVHTRADMERFVGAVKEFLEERKELVC